VRPRTVAFVVAGVLVAGMLVFLAVEVTRGGSASGSGGDEDGTAEGPGKRNPVAAQRSQPAPRPERSTGSEDDADPVASGRDPTRPGTAAGGSYTPVRPFPRTTAPTVAPAGQADPTTSNTDPEQNDKMAAATASYDSGDYQAAHEKALEILEGSPRNIKMLRIAVSTSCMFGEIDRARELNARLPKAQQEQMRKRCKKNGADL
jgi:hypothetical protein